MVMYLVGAGLVVGSILLYIGAMYYTSILGEIIAYFIIFGGIGYGVYKLAKRKLDIKIAVIIGIIFGLVLFVLFSYFVYVQNV